MKLNITNDNKLDLSLNELTEVPVKEMLAIPKATEIDLSCNCLKILSPNFATLTHITILDLSKNELTELPDNFGNLTNLRHLDLYSNKLTTLPVSFSRLKNLAWLDLKNNPLESQLNAVAGDCLVKEQCQSCAKKVVSYMQSIASDLEREKQRKLKAEREREAQVKAKQQKAIEKERKLKKAEREKRKAEAREERLRRQRTEQKAKEENVPLLPKSAELNGTVHSDPHKKKSGFLFCVFTLLLSIFVAFCAVLVAAHLYNGRKFDFPSLQHTLEEIRKLATVHVITWWKITQLQMFKVKEILVLWTDHVVSYWNTYTAS